MNSTLEFRGITKTFPGVIALNKVGFTAEGGQVVAMVGENGAGKSTLLKVLNGDYQPDDGEYIIDGEHCHFDTPRDAIDAGVSIIYQERQIVPYLTVAENVFMEAIPTNKYGLVDYKKLNNETQQILDEFKLKFRPTDKARNLSVAYQQMIEIMKAYRRQPKIIAFDEPTASLSDNEIETLFNIINELKKKNIIVLYVSHRMNEIFQISDEVVILKDGNFVEQLKTNEVDEHDIIQKMVGRDLGDVFNGLSRNDKIGDVVLEAKNIKAYNIKDVSFKLHAGEVLGFAGLVGAGRTETMRAIFGADPFDSGEILLNEKTVNIKSPSDAVNLGIALCPEDRKDQGIVSRRPIFENISMPILKSLVKNGFIDKTKEIKIAEDSKIELNIKTPDVYKHIGELSGGNQQKVILARWLATEPKVLILDEPTKGIDVGSKSEIYQLICDLAKRGIAVIMISSELTEVLGVSDRIVVMCQGRITGELLREEANERNVLTLAMLDMMSEKKKKEVSENE